MKRFFLHAGAFSFCAVILLIACSVWSLGPSGHYIGTWALTIDGGAGPGSSAGWMELRQEEGYLDADLLWRWGSVEPVASAMIKGDNLVVTRDWLYERRKDADGNAIRSHHLTSWFEFEPQGKDRLKGMAFIPDGKGQEYEIWPFSATRLPAMPAAPDLAKVRYGAPVGLFNGKDLSAWELINPKDANGWRVENGVLVNEPKQTEGKPHVNYGNLRTKQVFGDFRLAFGVNVPEGSNSGVYLRGIYEIQVADSYGKPLDPHNMGAVYSRVTPSAAAEKPAGQWQDMDITLCDRHVTVILNGRKIIDNKPVPGVTGGALTPDVAAPGPLYLKGDHGVVMYRDIVLTPIVE